MIVCAIVFGACYYFFWYKPANTESGVFLSTQSQSKSRIDSLGLGEATVIEPAILDKSKLNLPVAELSNDSVVEYRPNTDVEWVISLVKQNGEVFTQEEVKTIFDLEWRKNFDSWIYGYSIKEKGWTYANVIYSNGPYDTLQVAVLMVNIFEEGSKPFIRFDFQRYIIELEQRFNGIGLGVEISSSISVEEATARSSYLTNLRIKFDRHQTIVLKSDDTFKSIEFWNTLKAVGLEWGDGDLFHWYVSPEYGYDYFFSVWTSTYPGFFFPEEVKSGKMKPGDLVFGYSIPRSPDPEGVFEVMLETVKFCQGKLGGKILNQNGEHFDEIKEREKLKLHVTQMKKEGITPSSEMALRLF